MTASERYPMVPFDPLLAAALPATLDLWPAEVTPDAIPRVRELNETDVTSAIDDYLGGLPVDHEDRTVPGQAGAPDITLAVYRPQVRQPRVGCLYFIHGGGMISGNRFTDALGLPALVAELGVVAVSVEYRLAPENPHPAPVEDCYAGLCWVADHAAELGIDNARIVIAGESAGGGLAAATALLVRDRSGPAVLGQLLAAPMLDDRCSSPSVEQMDGVGTWGRTSNLTGWTALLGSARGTADVPSTAAPSRALDLHGLPAAFIDVGSAEIFRDESVDYAQRLWLAGVQAELHVWPGGYHSYYGIAPEAPISAATRSARRRWLAALMASVPSSALPPVAAH